MLIRAACIVLSPGEWEVLLWETTQQLQNCWDIQQSQPQSAGAR